ncbi:hypothetical protein HN807_07470 [Candidatus Bathyarchaeota archaeon]|nr:hypothetical protein [Candidatus Bathyarchaeota archaeon]MBT4423895.1 hypothetical protein [Candidatus Bathyarchaeota archaeon]MBT5643127.1 hypothetical protein [Candidatus Bathyarchaeota archaeon]MBT7186546.1 hypothetical protein [Candidatus Bathyarchaeota archaeon]MBT7346904.1 hypothetical protein [Candidatus Bathyarchaeota archaeon]
MTLYLVETIIGAFAVNDENVVKAQQNYPADPKAIAKIIERVREGNADVLKELFSNIGEDEKIVSSNQKLVDSLKDTMDIEHGEYIELANRFKETVPDLAVDNKAVSSVGKYYLLNHEVSKNVTRSDLHEALSDREVWLIPAVQLLSELDTVLNSLSGRMREWYGVHFPEMGRRVRDHGDYARIITTLGDRSNISTDGLMKLTLKKKDAVKIEAAASESMGANFDEYDISTIQSFTDSTLSMYKFREELVEYISTVTQEIAPNVSRMAGPILAAKLIDKAGGMRRLAMVPASTIQVMGAEKALFRSKKTNARPPKHGLLYQHPYVHAVPSEIRGRRARSLAAKIAIAARADVFSGNYIAEELAAQLKDF